MAKKQANKSKNGVESITELKTTSLTKPLLWSVVLHAIMLGLFSIGFISLCLKYNTLNPKAAIKVEKEQAEQKALEDKRKATAEKNAKAEAESKDVKKPEKAPDKVPQVIKDTQEVIKEQPTEPSTLNNFDDKL